MKSKRTINGLLIKSEITENQKTTYELKLQNAAHENIHISYLASEGRYTDEGNTISNLEMMEELEGEGELSPFATDQIEAIAQKFGVSLINNELTIIRNNNPINTKHYEFASLVNCIASINALWRFTDLFEN